MTMFGTGVRTLGVIRRRQGALPALFAALLLGPAGSEAAHTAARPDLEALTDAADLIVRARCVSQESRLEAGRISTYVRLQVIETLKGTPHGELEIRIPGGAIPVPGRADGLMLEAFVSQAPRFQESAESVLFLWAGPGPPGDRVPVLQVVGLSLGKMDVAADGTAAAPHLQRVTPHLASRTDLPLGVAPPGAELVERGARVPVSALVARIRARLGEGR